MEDPGKEIPFQGVYKVTTAGNVVLLTDSITRPNGIALSPDEKQLFVANSDPQKPCWYVFDLTAGDSLTNARIFYDASEASKQAAGSPDGMKIDKQGNIFATGPGGVWIFNKDAKLLGKINFPAPTSNCALTADEKTLFVTADNYVLRITMRQ
jgi:gluconolactonase